MSVCLSMYVCMYACSYVGVYVYFLYAQYHSSMTSALKCTTSQQYDVSPYASLKFYRHARMCMCVCVYIHAYIMHTYTHTYILTCTHKITAV